MYGYADQTPDPPTELRLFFQGFPILLDIDIQGFGYFFAWPAKA